jgi:hypothetical protein
MVLQSLYINTMSIRESERHQADLSREIAAAVDPVQKVRDQYSYSYYQRYLMAEKDERQKLALTQAGLTIIMCTVFGLLSGYLEKPSPPPGRLDLKKADT